MKLTSWAIRDAVVTSDLPAVVEIFSEVFPELRSRINEKWTAEPMAWLTYVRLDVIGDSYRYSCLDLWALRAGHFHRDKLLVSAKENIMYFPGVWRQPA